MAILRLLTMLTQLLSALILFVFTLRRGLFSLIAFRSRQPLPLAKDDALPTVLLLVPFRNEASRLPRLLSALSQLDYPAEKLTAVMIDDGSTDDSVTQLNGWQPPFVWRCHRLSQNVGKAAALNEALQTYVQGEIIAIYDADEQPEPNALRRLAVCFADKNVGAVSGQRRVGNALASPVASYAAYESLVHQRITSQAKDWLNLAPPLLGSNCAYRRSALAEIGLFRAGAFLEDSEATVKLACLGWRLRFTWEAISTHHAPETVHSYWSQHTRWARGFYETAQNSTELSEPLGGSVRDGVIPTVLRLELRLFSLGYLDRVALLLAGLSWAVRPVRWLGWMIAFNLLMPLFQIGQVLRLTQAPRRLWQRLIWLPALFGLDLAVAVFGLFQTTARTQRVWQEREH